MVSKSGLSLWRMFCGFTVLTSLIHLSISRSKSPEFFPHYAHPRHLISERCIFPDMVALTFDDFPNERIDDLLQNLSEWNATATFFVNGSYNASKPELERGPLSSRLKKIHGAGHQIASHTWDHVDLRTRDATGILYTMTRMDQWLAENVGIGAPRFMRPPYGECDAACARTLSLAGYKVVTWGVDTFDWKHQTPETVHLSISTVYAYLERLKRVAQTSKVVRMADIVLMHSSINTTISTVAPALLEAFGSEGFRFVSVAECLGYSPEMWYR